MTDYQPLLARALKGLGSNTSEARRGVYDRARQALLNQLRSINPPLADADITRERLALEDAIRKTETAAVQADPHSVRAGRAAEKPAAPSAEKPAAAAKPHVSAPAAPGAGAPHAAAPGASSSSSSSPSAPASGPAASSSLAAPPPGPRGPAARPLPPRERPATPAGTPTNGAHPPAREHLPPRNGARPPRDPNAPPPPGLARRFERGRAGPPPQDTQEISPDDFAPGARQHPPGEPGPALARTPGNTRARVLVAGFIVLLIAVAGMLGYMHRDRMLALLGIGGGPQVADAEKPKSSERITPAPGTEQTPQTTAPPAVDPAVAQRAVLYEENPGGGQQFQNFVGTAVWKTETVTLGAGRAPDLGLRVDIEIPDRHMSVVMKLRRNVDPSFPASHTIEVRFTTPNDPFGGVTDMRGMRAKGTETAQGTPIAAVVQKVKEGYFLLALPNIEEDSNLNMLRDRDWLDIPLVYSNGRRAVLTFQKGTPGSRAMNEAFLSWGKGN